jgi:hypothetical protein
MAVVIPILGDDAGLQKAIKSATKSFNDLKKSAVDVAKKAAVGFAALGAAGAIAVKAAIEDQKAQALLAQQIRATTGATDAQIKATEGFIDSTQRATGVADDQLRPALANLVRGTGDLSKSQELLDLSLNISAATGKDVEAVSIALSKAYNGNIGALTKLGVPIDEATKKSKDFGVAQEQLTTMFSGAAGAAADTMAGRFARLKIAFDEIVEQVGYYLMPIVERFAGFLLNTVVPYVQKLADAMGKNGLAGVFDVLGQSVIDRIQSLGVFGTTLLAVAAAIAAVVAVAKAYAIYVKLAAFAQQLWNIALMANPIGLIVLGVAALIAIVAVLIIKFGGFKKVAEAVTNAVIGFFENVVNFYIGGINKIIDGINLLIKAANFFGAGIKELGHIGEVEFGRVSFAAKAAKGEIRGVAEVAGAFAAKEGGTSEIKKATNAFVGMGDGAGGAGKKIETAKEKLSKYMDALKATTSAQRSVRDALKATTKANEDYANATKKMELTQLAFNQAITGYGKDSKQGKDAQSKLAKSQRDVERSGYAVEAAVFAVAEAEKELAKVRADPESTPQAIREAQIKLAEAKLSVVDATDSQTESTLLLNEAEAELDETINGVKEGSAKYTELLDELNQAKKDQVEASDKVTEAYERERDAVDKLREAEEKLRDVRKEVGKAIVIQGDAAMTVTGGATAAAASASATKGKAYGSFMEAVNALHPNAKALDSKTPVTASRKAFPALYKEYRDAGLALAAGGIVTRATQALIGESGAEAVIPLDRLNSFGNKTINITVNAGMGADESAIGDTIVDALRRYERRNGFVPITAQYANAL